MNVQAKNTEHTVFVRFAPPSSLLRRHHIENHFSQVGPIKKASLIIPKAPATTGDQEEEDGSSPSPPKAASYGFIKYTCASDAVTAAKQLNRSTLTLPPDEQSHYGEASSFKVTVELASVQMNKQQKHQQQQGGGGKGESTKDDDEEGDSSSTAKKTMEEAILQNKKKHNRIILRNLSFYAKESHIREAMEPFGTVLEVHVPTVQGRSRGFAFCTFATPAQAQKALTAAKPTSSSQEGGITIKQRKVQADFSVSKVQHQQQRETEQKLKRKQEYQSNVVSEQQGGATSHVKPEKEEEESDSDSENDNDSDDDDDDDDDSSNSGSDSEAKSEDDSDDMDEDSDEDEEADDAHSKEKVLQEQRQLFIRNLPFDASRHDVFQAFRKYGTVQAVYIVVDPKTKLPRGTCFVTYEKHAGAARAMIAAGAGSSDPKKKDTAAVSGSITGIDIKGRNLLVDYAVDKETATTLKRDQSVDGGQHIQHGKDKRNIYLKGEGRVDVDEEWEALGENDQNKRQRAWADKISKLKSPLFFINPYRLSIRNIAKGVEEGPLKKLLFDATQRGLEKGLVSVQDFVTHMKASGENTPREIMELTKALKTKSVPDKENPLSVASLDEKNTKHTIPSVYLDRNFEAAPAKGTKQPNGKKALAPSRGFAFAEFTHHVQALACLRELNNNPAYSEEFATAGRSAANAARVAKNGPKKKKQKMEDGETRDVKIPRLIVEFTVENKAKAKQQAERRAHLKAHQQKQKLETREKRELASTQKPKDGNEKSKSKQLGRGAKQREKKRLRHEEDQNGPSAQEKAEAKERKLKSQQLEKEKEIAKKKPKSVKPPKKQNKRQREDTEAEEHFSKLVNKYKEAFVGNADKKTVEQAVAIEPKKEAVADGKRWYE